MYVNGVEATNDSLSVLNLLVGTGNAIQVGSKQGTARSYATYNTYGFFDSLLSAEELANITSV